MKITLKEDVVIPAGKEMHMVSGLHIENFYHASIHSGVGEDSYRLQIPMDYVLHNLDKFEVTEEEGDPTFDQILSS